MNVEKNVFTKEVNKILSGNQNEDILIKLDKAYKLASGLENIEERNEAHSLVDEILEYLFKDKFSSNYSIPIDFINGPIGGVLFSIKFGVLEDVYTTSEITTIMSITRALISHDLDNEDSKLIAIQKGRAKNIIVYERDLKMYMMSKGMSTKEINLRIQLYKKHKAEGSHNESEIKDLINKQVKQLIAKD